MREDIEAIKRLKARYFRLMDTKDWDGLALVFTDDVRIDVTEDGGDVTDDLEAYMPFIRGALDGVTTVHHGHMPEIELTSDTTATGVWALEDYLWWPDDGPLKHLHGFGHYHETYEKDGGAWRIKTMTISRLHRIIEA